MRVKVLRAFLIREEVQPLGSEIDVTDAFGRELIASNKALRVAGQPVEQSGPMTLQTAGALAGVPQTATKPIKGKAK
jgi:hypothetical protein